MVLDILENQPNIKQVTIEVPDTKFVPPFDPEKDLLPSDWEKMNEVMMNFLSIVNPDNFYHFARDLRILDPEKVVPAAQKPKEAVDGMKSYLNTLLIYNDWRSYFVHAADFKTGSGEAQVTKLAPDKAFAIINGMSSGYKNFSGDSWLHFAKIIKSAKILFPDYFAQAQLDKNGVISGIADYLEDYLSANNPSWANFAEAAASLKLIYPDSMENIPALNDKSWEGMKAALNHYRDNSDWKQFSTLAANMKILAAREVRITTNGIVIEMEPEKTLMAETNSAIPEVKKF